MRRHVKRSLRAVGCRSDPVRPEECGSTTDSFEAACSGVRSPFAAARAAAYPRWSRGILRNKRVVALALVGGLALALVTAGPATAQPDGGQWDPTLPKLVSSGAPGDPLAIANASIQATQMATQTTLELGRKFLGSLGIGSRPAAATDTVTPERINRVYGRQAVEYVIRRGASQMGVPYSWGGGGPDGPTLGVDSGANTVGYDCSGFTQFAFAGVGVLIPKYSGDQYGTGRKIPPSEAKRGDLIFYEPRGS